MGEDGGVFGEKGLVEFAEGFSSDEGSGEVVDKYVMGFICEGSEAGEYGVLASFASLDPVDGREGGVIEDPFLDKLFLVVIFVYDN